jgi:hypothetical protein
MLTLGPGFVGGLPKESLGNHPDGRRDAALSYWFASRLLCRSTALESQSAKRLPTSDLAATWPEGGKAFG